MIDVEFPEVAFATSLGPGLARFVDGFSIDVTVEVEHPKSGKPWTLRSRLSARNGELGDVSDRHWSGGKVGGSGSHRSISSWRQTEWTEPLRTLSRDINAVLGPIVAANPDLLKRGKIASLVNKRASLIAKADKHDEDARATRERAALFTSAIEKIDADQPITDEERVAIDHYW